MLIRASGLPRKRITLSEHQICDDLAGGSQGSSAAMALLRKCRACGRNHNDTDHGAQHVAGQPQGLVVVDEDDWLDNSCFALIVYMFSDLFKRKDCNGPLCEFVPWPVSRMSMGL